MCDHLQNPEEPDGDVETHRTVLELTGVHQTGCWAHTNLLQLKKLNQHTHYNQQQKSVKFISTRMHSSRIRTVRFTGRLGGWFVCLGGVHPPDPEAHIPHCMLGYTPCPVHDGIYTFPPPLGTEGITHACENITLPQTSFAGGNNQSTILNPPAKDVILRLDGSTAICKALYVVTLSRKWIKIAFKVTS